MNLSVALMLAQLIFMTGVNATEYVVRNSGKGGKRYRIRGKVLE
jgi:hypothetical protein